MREECTCEGDVLSLLGLLTAFLAHTLISQNMYFPTHSSFCNIKYIFFLPHSMSAIACFSHTFLSHSSLTHPCAHSHLCWCLNTHT